MDDTRNIQRAERTRISTMSRSLLELRWGQCGVVMLVGLTVFIATTQDAIGQTTTTKSDTPRISRNAPTSETRTRSRTINSESQPALITGGILGSDGRPLNMANARLRAMLSMAPDGAPEVASVRANADGQFSIATTAIGAMMLEIMGTHHQREQVYLQLVPGFRLNIKARLGRIRYGNNFDSVAVVGDFNGFRTDTSARRLQKQRDGIWTVDIPSKSDSMVYGFIRVTSRGIVPGTSNDRASFNNDAYRSVANVRAGSARIEFDPARIVRDTMPAILVYSGGVEARVARLTDTIKAHSALADKALQSGKPMSAQAWLPIIQRIERSLSVERQPQVRAILTMDLLNIAKEGGAVAPSFGKAVLREFPPSSTVWQSLVSVAYDLSNVAVMVSDSVTELLRPQPRTLLSSSDSVRLRNYARHYASRIDSLIDSAPNESLRAQNIQFALFATRGWYPEKSAAYLSRMQAEYADDYVTEMALRMFGAERLLRPGARLPAISVAKLHDTTQLITNTSLMGKTVLIDFWASWCLPCLGEMSTLHDAYTKFHSSGLEILSVSLDQKMSDVDTFRSARWPMPWQHAWISGGLAAPELKPLEITGIPRVVLIGPDGNILAEGSELRGGALQTTLERVLK